MSSLREKLQLAVRNVDPEAAAHADDYLELLHELERWAGKINLTAIRDADSMITSHVLDSLVARPLLAGTSVLDVGTGAGFPGLPLAIAAPGKQFHLVDSNRRKIMFVQHVAGLLGLDNVVAVQARSEDYAPGHRFDTVIARAVASISRLLDIAGHHVGESGVFVALKGRYPADELDEIPREWEYEVKELVVPGLDAGSRHAVLLKQRDA